MLRGPAELQVCQLYMNCLLLFISMQQKVYLLYE